MLLYPSLTERLHGQHAALDAIIAGVDEDRLQAKPQADKWSIHEQIAHLACYQPVFLQRIETILTTDRPRLERYRAEEDPLFAQWCSWPTARLLTRIKEDRAAMTRLTHLSPEQLARTGGHPKLGELNVVQWTEAFLLHEAHHLFAVFQLVHQPPA